MPVDDKKAMPDKALDVQAEEYGKPAVLVSPLRFEQHSRKLIDVLCNPGREEADTRNLAFPTTQLM